MYITKYNSYSPTINKLYLKYLNRGITYKRRFKTNL